MSSTIFQAPPYDPQRDRRRRAALITILVVVVIAGLLAYRFRNFREERIVDHFFAALQAKDYEKAYGIWMHDPEWKQHSQQHAQYPYTEFHQDWGPGGEWGIISSYHVDGSVHPSGGSGVVVVVEVNHRTEKARIWVESRDKTLTFSPY